MRIPQIKSSITPKVFNKKGCKAAEISKKSAAKAKETLLENLTEKREILKQKELILFPELNFFGLPKWM